MAGMGLPIMLSTGMSTLNEVEDALIVLKKFGAIKEKTTVLQCNTDYPTPMNDANLKAMVSMKERFDISVGYSDHTLGIEAAIAAVAMGGRIIEKHLTLNRNMTGPDHKSSLEPEEFKQMVESIRNVEIALGDGLKKPTISESKNLVISRRSIVASRIINKGETFSNENICVKRPADGLSPMHWESVLGQVARKNFAKDEKITL